MSATVIELPWRARLRTNDKGKFLPDEANVDIALRAAPAIAGMIRYNDFSTQIEFTRAPPWRDAAAGSQWLDRDDTALLQWMQRETIGIRSASAISRCVEAVAKDLAYHPVRDYLKSLHWDGMPRLNGWLTRYMGAKGEESYLAAVGRRWMVSAIARVMRPGCQADHTLVFEGLQGAGKSRTARALAVRPEWFADRIPDLHSADAAIQLAGCWIVELAELAAVKRGENETVKAFLTRTNDVYRPPYGRWRITVPRQCVFIGSTNESAYLVDRTGNRRYWPVTCGDIDIEYLERDRDQLWAEALHAYESGEPWHLDNDEGKLAAAEQEERVVVTELEQEVANYLEKMEASGVKQIDMKQILTGALHLEPDKSDYADRAGRYSYAVLGVLRSHGWAKQKVVGRGKSRRNLFVKMYQGPLPLSIP
jgi:putative DNA primase/helicase